MNRHTVSLSQMLRLVGKQLDQASVRRLRRHISDNIELTKRWRRVLSVWTQLKDGEQLIGNGSGSDRCSGDLQLISRRTESRDLRRAEAIAAFVEGRLDRTSAARIEALCWSRPAWLIEIVSSFYDLTQVEVGEIETLDPDRLLRRLSGSFAGITPVVQSPGPDAAWPDDSVIVELAKTKVGPSSRISRIGFAYWSAAASLVLLGCFLIGRLNQSPRSMVAEPDKGNGSDKGQVDVAVQSAQVLPSISDASESSQLRMAFINPTTDGGESPEGSTTSSDSVVGPAEFAVIDWNKVLNDAAESSEPIVPPLDPDPSQPIEAEAVALAVPLEWRETKGIVATRSAADQPWQGLNTSLPATRRFEFATLPTSWARAGIENFGSLTLCENSQVRLWRTSEPSTRLHLSTARGQLAVDDLTEGVNIEIVAGPAEWRVLAQSDHTTLVVDCDGETPRLQIVSGDVLVNGELTLRKGDQTTWIANSTLAADRAHVRPEWVETPPAAIRSAIKGIDRTLLERFANAEDLIAELRAAPFDHEVANVQDRSVFARMLLGFEPQAFAMEVLESTDSRLSRDTLTWLLSQDRRQPTIRPIWIALARSTKQPNKIRTLFSWTDMANQRGRVPLETATTMIEWLTDDQLLFRQSGQLFLELAFGRIVEYEPHWPPAQRVAAGIQWRAAIAEFYRMRQRRDAAMGRNR